jgi:glyoxylase-like metal-dependent hydrolase (beta-lactamase superfamily II)
MSSAVLGDFEISLIRDSSYLWDGGALFGVVPRTLWARRSPPDELNRIRLAFNCYVIRTGGHTVLVETGGGDKMDERARERAGLTPNTEQLPSVLARHGVDPESIGVVINSHLHWDHCGGNTRLSAGGPRPNFPRARYFAARGEWEHAHERYIRDSVSYIDANYDPLVDSGQMTLVDGDCEVVPGVWMRHAPGHNRDMCVVTAESGGRTFCFFSDLVPTAAHVQPSWVASFDLYPVQTIETKFRWLAAAAAGEWLCSFSHDTEIDFTRIVPDAKKYYAVA